VEFGIVIGSVVATRKDPVYHGVRLLIVQPVDQYGNPTGRPIVVADPVCSAGPGDVVIFVHSPDASMAFGPDIWAPADAAVVGIVDHAAVGDRVTLETGEDVRR